MIVLSSWAGTIGLLRRKVFLLCVASTDLRTMEKDDDTVQITIILYKWWISTQNTLLQIPCVRTNLEWAHPRAYEIEKHWGKTAPPPEKLEYLSAKGGGIMTRPENWKHPDQYKTRDDVPATNTPGPLSAARGSLINVNR
jgi:hypothetical protein